MPPPVPQERLDELLQHPSLWRGRGAVSAPGLATGFAALDALLPGSGWPRQGLVEILTSGGGHGELSLWAPLLCRLTQAGDARWCAFIAPPFEPFAPAWQARGVRLDRLLMVRTPEPLWALEQSLLSGACALAFAWPAGTRSRVRMTELRRLALAAERGAALGVLIRPLQAAAQPTVAALRLAVTRRATCLRVELLKGRGVVPAVVELPLP
ncbi:MAG: translesion DNA synthesis-associated protein ImuA [Steroidobacteraceae bacterium]